VIASPNAESSAFTRQIDDQRQARRTEGKSWGIVKALGCVDPSQKLHSIRFGAGKHGARREIAECGNHARGNCGLDCPVRRVHVGTCGNRPNQHQGKICHGGFAALVSPSEILGRLVGEDALLIVTKCYANLFSCPGYIRGWDLLVKRM
jgi:hypothetical protein